MRSLGFLCFCLLLIAAQVFIPLSAETRRVPHDFPSIKSAVLAAHDGDLVEVDDGYYFEENIIIDKALKLKAKNILRAVIHSSNGNATAGAIFFVKAPAEIAGFILKNGINGIVQRDSPDVAWTAHDLAILNMRDSGIAINDTDKNVGRAALSDIIIDHCLDAYVTNDAHGMEVSNSLVSNCQRAFVGFDHFYFRVERVLIWNCKVPFDEHETPVISPRTNAITQGQEIVILAPQLDAERTGKEPRQFLSWLLVNTKAPAEGEAPTQRVGPGLGLTIAGDIYFRLKDYAYSSAFYADALRLGEEARSDEVIWRAHFGLARASEKQKDLDAALEHFRKAVGVLDRLREKLPLRVYNPGFFLDKMEVYVSFIRLLSELHKKDPSRKYLEEAFTCAEKSRARGFLDSFEEASVDFKATDFSRHREEQNRIAREISRLQVRLQRKDLSSTSRDELLQRLEETENAYHDLFIRINREDPQGAERRFPRPLGYEAVRQKLLPGDTALIEFILGEECSFAFLATNEGLFLTQLPAAGELRPLVNHYLKFLTLPEKKGFKAKRGGRKLYELLLGSFHSALQGRIAKIIVIPDGHLYYLPFESLLTAENSFLIEKYEIFYAPSASALIQLRERKKTGKGEMDLLAVANPSLAEPDRFIFGSPYNFPDLKHTVQEIKGISRVFESHKVEILFKRQAEEDKLKKLDWARYRIVHFATHGVVEDGNWKHSGLLLWRGEKSEEDGFFQPRDIYLLRLSSDLVVLSACQTAKGSLETGEGIVGLAGAFLFAGADAVVVSSWNIVDRSTAQLMESFYGCLAEGKRAAQALREAKLKMIRSEYSHPFFWAAFVLIGDSSKPVLAEKNSR